MNHVFYYDIFLSFAFSGRIQKQTNSNLMILWPQNQYSKFIGLFHMVIFKVRDLDHKNNTANKKVKFLSDISTLETEKKFRLITYVLMSLSLMINDL